MSALLQNLLVGISAGSAYGLLALGLVVVYKSSGVVNFAHGAMATLSAHVAYELAVRWNWPLPAAMLAAMALGGAVGSVSYLVLVARAQRASPHAAVMVTLGLALVLQGVVAAAWGSDTKAFAHAFADAPAVHLGLQVYATSYDAVLVATAATLSMLLAVWFQRTRCGLAARALASEPEAAALVGVVAARVHAVVWAGAAAVGALAGVLLAPRVFLEPAMMFGPLLKAFAAAVLGGMTSFPGAVLGGWLLGVLEALTGAYVSTALQPTLAFVVLVLVLVVRPAGLLVRREP